MLFKEYVANHYIPYHSGKTKNAKSLKNDLKMLDIMSSYNISDTELKRISPTDITLLLSTLEKDRHIAKSTVNRYRSRLNAVFNHALMNRHVEFNPVRFIKKYKEYPRGRYLSEEEIFALLSECRKSKNAELYTIVVLALNTGMRAGEILNLAVDNIMEKFISLSGKQTKSGLPRIVPLNESAVKVLKNHIESTAAASGHIFKSRSIRECFKYAKIKAEIGGLRFHDLRRTFAAYLKRYRNIPA